MKNGSMSSRVCKDCGSTEVFGDHISQKLLCSKCGSSNIKSTRNNQNREPLIQLSKRLKSRISVFFQVLVIGILGSLTTVHFAKLYQDRTKSEESHFQIFKNTDSRPTNEKKKQRPSRESFQFNFSQISSVYDVIRNIYYWRTPVYVCNYPMPPDYRTQNHRHCMSEWENIGKMKQLPTIHDLIRQDVYETVNTIKSVCEQNIHGFSSSNIIYFFLTDFNPNGSKEKMRELICSQNNDTIIAKVRRFYETQYTKKVVDNNLNPKPFMVTIPASYFENGISGSTYTLNGEFTLRTNGKMELTFLSTQNPFSRASISLKSATNILQEEGFKKASEIVDYNQAKYGFDSNNSIAYRFSEFMGLVSEQKISSIMVCEPNRKDRERGETILFKKTDSNKTYVVSIYFWDKDVNEKLFRSKHITVFDSCLTRK